MTVDKATNELINIFAEINSGRIYVSTARAADYRKRMTKIISEVYSSGYDDGQSDYEMNRG